MPHPIRVAETPDGALAYAIAVPPEHLPAVRPDALLAAWRVAHDGAHRQRWGRHRRLRFARAGAAATEIAIADPDAAAWAEAIDAAVGLDSLAGIALCLRLLALVEVLTRATWLAPLFDVTRDGVDLHPRLVAAAASLPLDGTARLDEPELRRHLAGTPSITGPGWDRDCHVGHAGADGLWQRSRPCEGRVACAETGAEAVTGSGAGTFR